MKKTITVMLSIIMLASAGSVIAADKKRDWQEGKLIDITSESRTYGSVVNGVGSVGQGDRIRYVIDDGKYIYTAYHTHFRRDKALPLTIKAKVKFAIEKGKFYILDEDGEEHELKLEKKALKEE